MKSTSFVSNVIVTEKQRQSTKEYFTIRPWERGKVTGLWPGNGVWSLVGGHGNGLWSLVSGQYWPHFRNRAITRESSRSQEWQKGNRCKQGQVGQRCVLFEWTSFMNECFFFLWMNVVCEWINDRMNELLDVCFFYWIRTNFLLKQGQVGQ